MAYFYRLVSPANKINKDITMIQHIDLKLRKDFDFNNPYLILNRKNIDIDSFNYVLMENRYYFVKNKTRLNNSLVKIDLELDPLMTFKDFILNSNLNITGISDFNLANQANETVNYNSQIVLIVMPVWNQVLI